MWKLTSVTLIEYIKPQKLWQTVKSQLSIKEAATIVYFSKSAKTLMQATMVITFAKIGIGGTSD